MGMRRREAGQGLLSGIRLHAGSET